VLALLSRVREDAVGNTAVQERRRQDMKNLLFYRGGPDNQHIIWDRDQWVRRPYDGDAGIPAWIPRICTNQFAKKIDGVASLLSQSNPAKMIVPMTDDDRDLAAADVAENALPVLEEEIGYPRMRAELNAHVTLTSTVAVLYYYDASDKYGIGTLPGYVCTNPACEDAAAGTIYDAEQVAVQLESPDGGEPLDGTDCPTCGAPVQEVPDAVQRPIGRLRAEVANCFEHTLPSSAKTTDAEQLPWVYFHSSADEHVLCAMYPKHATKIRESARSAGKQGEARHLARQMQRLSSPFSASTGRGGGQQEKVGPIVYRLQHDPIEDDEFYFPEGLYAVTLGDDLVLEAGPLPVLDPLTQKRRKSVLVRTYAPMPGTSFGKPVADDLCPLQEQRNHYEMLAFMILMNHAAPRTYIPADVTLVDPISGVPGQTVRFQSMSGSGPIDRPGQNIPPSLPLMIEAVDKAMDELSGLNAVLGGERPDGDPTLGEIEILQERGMSAMRAPLDEQAEFERKQGRLLLDLARQTAWSPRFRRIQGENKQWELKAFTGADLRGNIDISIEPLSAWPKSPLMQQMRTEKAVEMGAIMPSADPEIALKLLTNMGLSDLKPSLDEDRKQVARELDRWKAATSPADIQPPDFMAINPAVHLLLKKGWLKTEEAEAIKYSNPALWQAWLGHVSMLEQAMMPAPAPAEGAAPSGEEPQSTNAVDAAVQAGVLIPEGATGDPLHEAVQSGALIPEGAAQAAGPSVDSLMAEGVLTPLPFNEGVQP
jgi:hypothetical protein